MSFCNAESDAVPLTQAEMDELVQLAGQTFSAAEAIEAEANRATNDGLDDKAITAISFLLWHFQIQHRSGSHGHSGRQTVAS